MKIFDFLSIKIAIVQNQEDFREINNYIKFVFLCGQYFSKLLIAYLEKQKIEYCEFEMQITLIFLFLQL